MRHDEIEAHVQEALREQWSAFATAHPHLVAAIDAGYWSAVIADSLDGDPAFQAAMHTAYALGLLRERGPAIVREFVERWLKRLS